MTNRGESQKRLEARNTQSEVFSSDIARNVLTTMVLCRGAQGWARTTRSPKKACDWVWKRALLKRITIKKKIVWLINSTGPYQKNISV